MSTSDVSCDMCGFCRRDGASGGNGLTRHRPMLASDGNSHTVTEDNAHMTNNYMNSTKISFAYVLNITKLLPLTVP